MLHIPYFVIFLNKITTFSLIDWRREKEKTNARLTRFMRKILDTLLVYNHYFSLSPSLKAWATSSPKATYFAELGSKAII